MSIQPQKNSLSSITLCENDLEIIDLALKEDLGFPFCDRTTSLFNIENQNHLAQAYILSKHPEPIVLCGLNVVTEILSRSLSTYEIQTPFLDGNVIEPGETLLTVIAPRKVLWMFERIILNFLQRLCAIATLTSKFVQKVEGTKAKILDTRKTTPGLRHLEKYAVRCGGGVNHRMGLYDAIMIKDTHVDLMGGFSSILSSLKKQKNNDVPVIIEVQSLKELEIVLEEHEGTIDRVLLDNMELSQLKKCVRKCEGVMLTEASGNVHLDNVSFIAATQVDFISVGKITHSAGAVDLSMKCN